MSSLYSCKKPITLSIKVSHGGAGKIIKKTVCIPIVAPRPKISPFQESMPNVSNLRLERLLIDKFLSARNETLSPDESDDNAIKETPSLSAFVSSVK